MNREAFSHSSPEALLRPATSVDKYHASVIAVYLAIAGVYWFPGVPHLLLADIKSALYFAAVAVGVLRVPRFTGEQSKLVYGLVACAVAAFVSNALNSDMETGLLQSREFILPLLWLVALLGLKPAGYCWLLRCLTVSMTFFLMLALLQLAASVGLVQDWEAPLELLDRAGDRSGEAAIRVLEEGSIVRAGFAATSTGWGAVLAPVALLAATLYRRDRARPYRAKTFAALALIGSVSSIAATSARGGVAAIIVGTIFELAAARKGRLFALFVVFSIAMIMWQLDVTALLPDNYFRGFDASGSLFSIIDSASTGRLESFLGALNHFEESPIIGVGPEEAVVWINNFETVQPHNTWLRILAESGLLLGIPVLYVTWRMLRLASIDRAGSHGESERSNISWPSVGPVIVGGLVLAFVEPRIIFGTFNANAVFWTAVWLATVRTMSRMPSSPSP
jgi:hypothetical protein